MRRDEAICPSSCPHASFQFIPVYPIAYEIGDGKYSRVLKPIGKIAAVSLLSSLLWIGMGLSLGYGCHRLYQAGRSFPGMERLGFNQAIFRTASVAAYALALGGLAQ